jgi:aspartyl-tRNA(Asn)/glutamyl-tRNA(Gln) amidotransferase subunit A
LKPAGALQIARAVAQGRSAAEAVVAQALDRIAEVDGRLNAFTAVLRERALEDARRLDARIASGAPPGPLAGAPFAVKNLFDIEGLPTLAGSRIRRHAPAATRDAALIARLKAADAILVGALNMDEFAYGFVTENHHYGPTHNPHDLDRIAGGSSGGSAVAVSAGLVPLTLGSDTNGSIRVPAALCGVFGLKPTFGALSREGMFPFVDSLDHAGVFARSTQDLAAAFDVLRGSGSPIGPRLATLAERPLRIGVLGDWFSQGAFPEVLEGLAQVAEALAAVPGVEARGAEAARAAAFCLTGYEGGRLHRAELKARPQDFDPAVRERLMAGALLPDEVAAMAERCRAAFREVFARLFEDHDILLAPTVPCPAPLIGQSTMVLDGQPVPVRPNLGAYTQPLSFIGVPVLSAPVDRPGLPVGVQIIAAPGREDLILALAWRLEAEGMVGWRPPPGVQ